MAERNPDIVSEYHVHIYFMDAEARAHAFRLRERLLDSFNGVAGGVRDVPGGPHPAPDLLVSLPVERFADAVPFLMLNRHGLSILVHPETGAPLADHTENALWLGRPLAVNEEFLQAFENRQAAANRRA